MWPPRGGNSTEKREGGNGLVAVAIDKDKNSQTALKWATDNFLHKGQMVILIHVKLRPSSYTGTRAITDPDRDLDSLVLKDDPQSKELFLPFRCFCTRKDISCKDVVLEESDVARALIDYVCLTAIETLILGASKTGFLRFKSVDIPGTVIKNAPDFCSVYVVVNRKLSSTRSATYTAPFVSPLIAELCQMPVLNRTHQKVVLGKPLIELRRKSHDETDFFSEPNRGQRWSAGSEMDSLKPMHIGQRSNDINSPTSMSFFSMEFYALVGVLTILASYVAKKRLY